MDDSNSELPRKRRKRLKSASQNKFQSQTSNAEVSDHIFEIDHDIKMLFSVKSDLEVLYCLANTNKVNNLRDKHFVDFSTHGFHSFGLLSLMSLGQKKE